MEKCSIMGFKVVSLNIFLLFLVLPVLSFTQNGKGESERYLKLARKSEKEGKEHVALSYLTKALEYDAKNALVFEERGDIHVVLEEYDKAIRDYEAAIKLEEHERLYYKLAVTHSNEGDDRECLIYLQKAMEFDFENYAYYYYRGISKMRMGNNAEALVEFNKADRLHANDHNVLYHRALVHMHMHHYKMGLIDVNKAIELFPGIADYYYEKGACNYKLGQYNDAIKDFTNAMKYGDDLDCYRARGLAYDKLRKFELAEADFRYYLKLNPHNAEVQYQFGLVEYHAEKFSNAEDLFNTVLKSETQNKYAYFYRGMVRFKMKRHDEACKDFEMCKKLGYTSGYNQMKANCKY